jgi:ActR/RegA family two-component response regulator
MEKEKINLLIVDDEEEFLKSISRSLELRDFHVIAVNRGEKAIEAAKNNPLDIALVDLKMPGISGEGTLKLLKQEHKWMEVVILTGHGAIDSAVECTKSGAYSYLQKPCELNQLLCALQDFHFQQPQGNSSQAERNGQRGLISVIMSICVPLVSLGEFPFVGQRNTCYF